MVMLTRKLGFLLMLKGPNMMENGFKVRGMAKGNTRTLMGRNMMDNGGRIQNMAKETSFGPQEGIRIQGNGKGMYEKGTEY